MSDEYLIYEFLWSSPCKYAFDSAI